MKKIGTLILAIGLVLGITGCKAEVESEYTINYDAAGHGTAPEAKTVEEGYKLTEADLPALTADGFDFGGWKFNEKIVAAGEEVVSDMTLTAAWTEWGTVAAPTFTVPASEVDKGTKVTIKSATEGAVIYYTTDGSAPTASSTKYESEIVITAATTIKAFAIKSGMKDSEATSVEYTVYFNPVTNLTAKCTASGTVKLTWTNPSDADFAKVVITYGTDGKVEVLKTATPNNEATITGLTNEKEYSFTVKAYDNAENESSGVSVKCKLGKSYTLAANSNGGLEGYSLQAQGETVKETWMSENGNLKVGGTEIEKTSEVIAVPTGTVATVTMPDDSSWSGYIEEGADSFWKGVFLKDRKIKLDPFVMSQYQVTEQLWTQIMGGTATTSIKPKADITWYQACAFCNELTKKTMTEADCVYYSDSDLKAPYTATDASSKTTPYIAYNTETKKWTKKGYRLPTEAEWEFAARGGNPNAAEWSYAYSGVNSSGMVIDSTKANQTNYNSDGWLEKDDNLSEYAVYKYSGGKKADVGTKKANNLNLYDMSGNVNEWCYDWHNDTASSNDSAYTVDGYVQNPLGSSSEANRVERGGYYDDYAYGCSVSNRYYYRPSGSNYDLGFRVVRSTQ